MAEIAVSVARDQLLPLLRKEANLLIGIHKEFADIKVELESIQAFIKNADRRAEAEGDTTSEGIRIWVKQLREVAFRLEDAIDEYMIYVGQQPLHTGCVALLYEIINLIKTFIPRHRIASEIQDIKSSLVGIKERSKAYGFQIQPSFEEGTSDSRERQNVLRHASEMVSLFIEDAEVVGFEAPREELIGWLVDGQTERTVISVVGMGGSGKTTLGRKVFDNPKVMGHFNCHAWITVSQSYTVEGLLRDMLQKFYREMKEALPQDIYKMDRESLIHEVRSCVEQKRYVVFFDDVWNVNFWDEIKNAVFDNNKGRRLLITTRNMGVAEFCKQSPFVHVHELQPLPPEKSWELFCRKAFRSDFDGRCPEELRDISLEIVRKCEGLPLAIAAIGGLLSIKKEKNATEWQKFNQNLRSELELNPHLTGTTKILALSYNDLPYNLKSCFLYFGIYPEDYPISCERLIRQWIAEGFVKEEEGKTLEEAGQQHLTELIYRSLVQVSEIDSDGKARICRVHDLLREMASKKNEDLSFCRFVTKENQSTLSGIMRRLTIATESNDFMGSIESSHIRSLYIFRDTELPEWLVKKVPKLYKLLKVLDFENSPLHYVPKNLGNLLHLRYLSLRNTKVQSLPKSIGKLQNLESLDLRQTHVHEMPREINNLKKLRHLQGYPPNYDTEDGFISLRSVTNGCQMKDGIGGLTSLETLYFVEAAHGGIELIAELGKLRQIRVLGLIHVTQEYGTTLCSSINEMHNLESLDITASANEVIDLHYIASPPQIRKLRLRGRLEKLPDWVSKLQSLVKLSLLNSNLTDDPLKLLKNLSNLLYLLMFDDAYKGESLHFQEGGFQKLKELRLGYLSSLNSIVIDTGALPTLKRFELFATQLNGVPYGIHHLANLEVLNIDGYSQLDLIRASISMEDTE